MDRNEYVETFCSHMHGRAELLLLEFYPETDKTVLTLIQNLFETIFHNATFRRNLEIFKNHVIGREIDLPLNQNKIYSYNSKEEGPSLNELLQSMNSFCSLNQWNNLGKDLVYEHAKEAVIITTRRYFNFTSNANYEYKF